MAFSYNPLTWFPKQDTFDLYKPKDRLIYSYFNGKDIVKADPMVLCRRLTGYGEELAADIDAAINPFLAHGEFGNAQEVGRKNIEEKVRSIFDIKPFTEGGLTEGECGALLAHFLTFIGYLKKNYNPIAIPAKETSAPTKSSATGVESATENSSASGSTVNVRFVETHTLSSSAVELPSERLTPEEDILMP